MAGELSREAREGFPEEGTVETRRTGPGQS